MAANKIAVIVLLLPAIFNRVDAQSTLQQGVVYKKATSMRLADVQVRNKRNLAIARSNLYGIFSIPAAPGDTLEMISPGYNNSLLIIGDLSDKICFLEPAIALPEVVIKETSVKTDLDEVKKGYRRKSVFYTGTPHYYYLFLKPMTFIYENFKSEVINARKFNRFAKNELSYQQIASRFNDDAIKKSVTIKSEELEDFKSIYWPSIEQLNGWNDYDLSTYIINSYRDFTAGKD